MKLFIIFLNLYLVVGNQEIDKNTLNYEQCFTLPPKIINSYEIYNSHDCPHSYIKYKEYYEYLNVKKDDNCIINYGTKIDSEVTKNSNTNLVKIYAVCCK